MMKQILWIFTCGLFIIACSNTKQNKGHSDSSSVTDNGVNISQEQNDGLINRDTIWNISDTYDLQFTKYDTELDKWYSPHIVNRKNNTSATIEGHEDDNGSELWYQLSPNGRYIVLDNISIGWVESESDKFLHENYFCELIDLENAKVIHRMQSDCDGKWDNDNNWISSDGDKLIFSTGK